MTQLIISNKQMKDIVKKVRSMKESGLLLKGVSKTIQNEKRKKQKCAKGVIQADDGAIRVG